MSDVAHTNAGFIPFVAPQVAGIAPQSFDFGQIAQQIAAQIVPILPGLVTSVLSAHPTIGPQVRAQSASSQAVAPQSLFNFGLNTPAGGAGIGLLGAAPTPGVMPQGIDFGYIAQQIAGQVLPILPGLVLGVLSAHPLIGPQLRGQSSPQAAVPFGVTPQGFDPGQLVQQIVKTAVPLLPVLITSLLSAHPALAPQLQAQSVLPNGFLSQSPFNFGVNTPNGGAGMGLFNAAPTGGIAPQGFDFSHLTQQIAGQVVPILPGLITSILSTNPMLGAQLQARGQTTH